MSFDIYPSVKGLTWTVMRSTKDNVLKPRATNFYKQAIAQTRNPIRLWTLMYEYLYGASVSPANTQPYFPYTDIDTLEGFWLQHYGGTDDFLFLDPLRNSIGPGVLSTAWAPYLRLAPNMGILDPSGHWQKCITGGFTAATMPTWNDSGGITTESSGVQYQDMGNFTSLGHFPNLFAQLQLWNDGAGNFYSPIQNYLGGKFWEDITDLNPALTYPYTGAGTISVYANGVAQTVGAPGSGITVGVYGPGLALPTQSSYGLYLKWYSEPTPPITVTLSYYWRVCFSEDSMDWEEFMQNLMTIGGSNSKNGVGQLILESSRPFYYGGS